MDPPKSLKKLCTPALVYFIISMVFYVLLLLQNIGNSTKYHIGSFSTNVPSTILIFILKFLYIIFWTWILNLLCKGGFSILSWLFILFPLLLFFVVLGLLIIR